MIPWIAAGVSAAAGLALGPFLAQAVRAEVPTVRVPPAWLAALTALLFGAVALAVTSQPEAWGAGDTPVAALAVMLAFQWAAAWGLLLAVVDAVTHRLPNRIVLPGYAVVAFLLAAATVAAGAADALLRAAAAGAALFGFFAVVRALGPGGMGGGDVKLAGVLGALLGWLGVSTLVTGVLAMFLGAGLFGIVLMSTGRAGRRTALPFGPWMIGGTWAAIALGAVFGDASVPF